MIHPPHSRVLVVDDDRHLLEWLADVLRSDEIDVRTAATSAAALLILDEWGPHVVVTDLRLPDIDGLELMHQIRQRDQPPDVIVLTGFGTVVEAVRAMQQGAFSFLEKPIDPEALGAEVRRAVAIARTRGDGPGPRRRARGTEAGASFVGTHPSIRALFETVDQVARSAANCLITGENGTGKELIATALHQASGRSRRRFVTVNCAAMPADLIEAELFGHRRGAFTGASNDRAGLFELASGGTLLLDEVCEMPPYLQSKLLRVLQEREYRPLGSTRTVPVDVRLICATNVDVDRAVADGRLRPDLFFRVNTITLKIPALRDRASDIPLIAGHFLDVFRRRYGKDVRGLSPDALTRLRRHRWPGNARELQNVMERAVVLAAGASIEVSELPGNIGTGAGLGLEPPLPLTTLKALERVAIVQALEMANWNKKAAALDLGLYRPTLYSRMRLHHIEDPRRRATA